MSGPHAAGSDVFHMVYDRRDGGSVYAAVNNLIWGPGIQISRDLGRSWVNPQQEPRFHGAADGGAGPAVQRLWHIEPGRDAEPGVIYVGAEPASLFKSEDSGLNWQEVSSLSSHPTRQQWQPGLGGLCLHSMVLDPENLGRMWVGMSAVGVFRSDDSGESWDPVNRGVRADFLPERFPEFGQCPHKLVAHPSRPAVLYQQNHCGVFRSDSGGDEWEDITQDLPSRFGFVLGIHNRDPDTIYVLPEDQVVADGDVGGGQRYVTDAKFRVFRSRNGGRDWQPMTQGLPQEHAYLHVMREGMAIDHLDPCGVYLGTTSGQIFASKDAGDSWELMFENLPPINSLECAEVA